jgi:hypothetical protein
VPSGDHVVDKRCLNERFSQKAEPPACGDGGVIGLAGLSFPTLAKVEAMALLAICIVVIDLAMTFG